MDAIRKSSSWVALACAFALSAGNAWAQSANAGAIAGKITDSTGAVISDAKVNAKNTATGTNYDTVSSSTGDFRFQNVLPGAYDVTITAAGFKQSVRTGIVVQVASLSPVNVTLDVGGQTEIVTVTGDAPVVQTETSDIGNVVTTQQVVDLPLGLGGIGATRSPEAFVFLTPGTIGPGTNNGSGGVFESKISGGQNFGTEILLDGASMYRSENGSSFDETGPSVDAISEFKVITSTLPAELGRTTGGIETFSTKSGTNSFHGVAYEIFQNEAMNANSFFNNYNISQNPDDPAVVSANQRATDKKNDYGGTLGGPVWIPKVYNGKGKSFFFFSWEQFRQTQGQTETSSVPSDAERNGDLSAYLTDTVIGTNPCDGKPIFQGEIFDPTTTTTVGGVECRLPFMVNGRLNQIPTERLSPVAQNVLSYVPHAQTSAQFSNFSYLQPYPIANTLMTVRIDQVLGQRHKVYFSYNSRDNTRLSDFPRFPGPANNGGQFQNFFTHFYRGGWDYSISPTLLNHLNLGFNRTSSINISQAVTYGKDWPSVLGITNVSGATFPQFNVGEGLAQIGFTVNNYTYDNGYRFNDSVSWTKGAHNLKAGFDYRYQIFEPISYNNESGTFNFARGQTAATIATNGQGGNSFGSFLLGYDQNQNLTAYASQPKWLMYYYALFAQDDWKITPTFTLNLGVRWEVDSPRWEHRGNTSNLSLTAPNPGAGNFPGALVFAGVPTNGQPPDSRNGVVKERWADIYYGDVAPRIGFSWAPAAFNGRAVLRGGYGIYYGALTEAEFGGGLQTGFQANPSPTVLNGFDPQYNLDSGFPAYAEPPNLDPAQQNNQQPQYVGPSYGKPAMTQNWSMQLQQEIVSDLIFTIGYVGQHSTRLHSQFDPVDPLPEQYFSLGNTLNANVGDPSAVGINPPYEGFTGTVAQALRPLPQYNGVNTDCCLENLGQSSFNALEVSLNRRFHNGLSLLASYTWSKTISNADSILPVFATFAGGGSPQNPFNLKADKSISAQDIPQVFVVSYLYQLPLGANKKYLNKQNKFVSRAVSGWEIGGVQRYQTGQPLAFGCATGIPAVQNCIAYNRVPSQPLLRPGFTTSTFQSPTTDIFNNAALLDQNGSAREGGAYSFGNIPRVTAEARSQTFANEDFSLNKRTSITEQTDILFQAEAFNAFNRHVFGRPDTSGPNSSTFGFINSTVDSPRILQLSLRFEF